MRWEGGPRWLSLCPNLLQTCLPPFCCCSSFIRTCHSVLARGGQLGSPKLGPGISTVTISKALSSSYLGWVEIILEVIN